MGIQINGQTDTVTAIDGSLNVGGDVTIPGVLTYDDVTNVDSIGVVTARSSVNVGASGNPHGKLHVYTDSLNADNAYNGQNFGIVVETEDGDDDGDEGNGICFTQQYSADGVDSSKVRTGAIIGFKDQATGNFGGGLKFKVQPFGASPLLTSMVLDKSGNIGIGTDNPTELITVGSAVTTALLEIKPQLGAIDINVSSGDFAPHYQNNLIIYKGQPSSGTEKLRITSTGAVQITGVDDQDNLLVKAGNTHFAVHQDDTDGEVSLRSQDGSGSNNSKYMTFYTNPSGSAAAERLRITSGGSVGIGTDNPGSKLTVYESGGNAKLQLQRSNTANDTDDYGSILWRSAGGTAVGGINVARQTAENDGYMFFQTTESGSSMTERLRILADGTIRKGTANSGNAKAPVELFFQKRSTQIGKRVHQGSGVNATTHNILNIDSWQSANSHAFIYVTVYYVSPVANYGGRMECYATAVNSGGSVSGGQGTFATADAGRWGNPGTPSLSWSGSTLRFTTFAHAYIDYSLDITCIAYDGAVVSYYGN